LETLKLKCHEEIFKVQFSLAIARLGFCIIIWDLTFQFYLRLSSDACFSFETFKNIMRREFFVLDRVVSKSLCAPTRKKSWFCDSFFTDRCFWGLSVGHSLIHSVHLVLIFH